MSDHLIIFDTTLRDGEQSPGASMTAEEKMRIAKQLERFLDFTGPKAARNAAAEQCSNERKAPPCGEPRPASTSLMIA